MLRQAGLSLTPLGFVAACAAAAAVVTVLASFALPPLVAIGAGIGLGCILPTLVLRLRQRKRIDALVRQLPDALDLMGRGLRVGHPLNATIASVANDMVDPIATEFGIMVDQIAYGDTLVDAFGDFADRIDTEDARYLAVSVAIQNGTGGDLAQVLSTLALVIRDRMSMRRKIKAISAEGRLTSTFLSGLPVFIFVSTSISAPGYYADVMDDPLFRPFAIVVVTLIVVNYLIMRRLVNFRF
jgi:tight adherence protein B